MNQWSWVAVNDSSGLKSNGSISLINKNFLGFSEVGDFANLFIKLVLEKGGLVMGTGETVGEFDVLGISLGKGFGEGMVDVVEVLDLGLVGVAGDAGVVQFNSGSIEISIKLSNSTVKLINLGHESMIGGIQLLTLGGQSGVSSLKTGTIRSGTIKKVSEFSNLSVESSNLFSRNGSSLFKLANSSL